MDKLEKVELIREKTGVSYDDAKVALEASNDDVLDAIIWLERLGKATAQTASYTTTSTEPGPVSPEMVQAQTAYQQSSKKSKVGDYFSKILDEVKRLLKKSVDTTFVAEHNGERVIALPILIVILGIFLWGATLWLLIIGLFFGLRYHIEGVSRMTVDINQMMDKAGEVAESIKDDVMGDSEEKKEN